MANGIDKIKLAQELDIFAKEAGGNATFNDFIKHLSIKGVIPDTSKKSIAAVRRALSKDQKGCLTSSNIDWKKAEAGIIRALQYFRSQGVRPTLRTLYYQLVSQNIIPNTKSCYKSLSKHLVEMRKAGKVAWNAIEDSARNVYGEFEDARFDEGVGESVANELKDKLKTFAPKEILREFFDYIANTSKAKVERWADQPTVAEIWIEKEALANTIVHWTENLNVKVRVNKGYSSWTFIYENARDLQRILNHHNRVAIFYVGDLDPSGEDMERFLKEALAYFGLDSDQIDFERLSITEEQVDEYHLPPRPDDAETIAKLHRDSRFANYTKDYVVEVDAMVAFAPEQFRKMIVDAINGVWDQEIYDDLLERADEENETMKEALADVKKQAREILRNLPDDEDSED